MYTGALFCNGTNAASLLATRARLRREQDTQQQQRGQSFEGAGGEGEEVGECRRRQALHSDQTWNKHTSPPFGSSHVAALLLTNPFPNHRFVHACLCECVWWGTVARQGASMASRKGERRGGGRGRFSALAKQLHGALSGVLSVYVCVYMCACARVCFHMLVAGALISVKGGDGRGGRDS